jgi:hypothetical protein
MQYSFVGVDNNEVVCGCFNIPYARPLGRPRILSVPGLEPYDASTERCELERRVDPGVHVIPRAYLFTCFLIFLHKL